MPSNARTQSHSAPTRSIGFGPHQVNRNPFEKRARGRGSDYSEHVESAQEVGEVEGPRQEEVISVSSDSSQDFAILPDKPATRQQAKINLLSSGTPRLKRKDTIDEALVASPKASKRIRVQPSLSWDDPTSMTTAELIHSQKSTSSHMASRLVDLEARIAELEAENGQLKADEQDWQLERMDMYEEDMRNGDKIQKADRALEEMGKVVAEVERLRRWKAGAQQVVGRAEHHLRIARGVLESEISRLDTTIRNNRNTGPFGRRRRKARAQGQVKFAEENLRKACGWLGCEIYDQAEEEGEDEAEEGWKMIDEALEEEELYRADDVYERAE